MRLIGLAVALPACLALAVGTAVPASALTPSADQESRSVSPRSCVATPAGVDWTAQTPVAAVAWSSVTWGGPAGQQKFVAVSESATVMTSPDGVTWTAQTAASNIQWKSVTWGGPGGQEKFVAVSQSGTGNRVMTSPDGVTWTSQTSAADYAWQSVTWGGPAGQEKFVAVATSGALTQVMTSPDGVSWTLQSTPITQLWRSVTWGGPAGQERFVAVSGNTNSTQLMTSPDGVNWTAQASAAALVSSVTWGGPSGQQTFVAVSTQLGAGLNRVMTSPDGLTWTARTPAADNSWRSVAWSSSAGLFVAVSSNGTADRVMTSPDGITWTSRSAIASTQWQSVVWGGPAGQEKFVAVASTGYPDTLMTSSATACPAPPRIPPGPPVDVQVEATLLGVRVAWKAPIDTGTDSVSLYAVRAWPGGPVCQVYASFTSCDVTGLDPEVDYYFTVVAMSGAGWGSASDPSSTIRPLAPRAPSAPIDVIASAGDTSAEVLWSPPADPGSGPVVEYRVTSTPAGALCTTTRRSCSVTGLANGTSYRFIVEARNGVGWSTASAPSNAVTPLTPSLTITASRDGRSVRVVGESSGVPRGTQVTAWMRIDAEPDFVPGTSSVFVTADGAFTWQRRLPPAKTIVIYVTSGGARSNTVTLPAQGRASP